MGRKHVIKSFKMIDSGDLSANITSNITNVSNLDKGSIHVSWTGSSPSSTLVVQARNGEDASWYELSFGSTISISGNSGNHQLVLEEMPFTDIRIVTTFTSGTGSLDATITSKTVGA